MDTRDPSERPPRLVPCAADACFSYRTIHERQPAIIESIVRSASPPLPPGVAAALRALAAACAAGAALRPLPAGDAAWGAAHAGKHASGSWNDTDIWYLEHVFYRYILDIVGYARGRADPFAGHKAAALDGATGAADGLVALSESTECAHCA